MATAKRKAGSVGKPARSAAKKASGSPAGKRARAKVAGRPAAVRGATKRPAGAVEAQPHPAAKGAARKTQAPAPKRAAAAPKRSRGAAGAHGRARRTVATDASVLAFIERVPDPAVRADCIALNALLSEATGAPPRMWGASIVGFGRYGHRYSSGHVGDWPVCGYSPRKQNLTVYVMAGFERFPDIMARLGRYKTGKSCLYLNRLADIDAGVLRELVAASSAQLARMYG